MSVITFVNNLDEETGKTMSLVAIATNMAIEYNNRILIISTTNKEDKIRNCYFDESENKKTRFGLFGQKQTIDTENGIEGIAKISRSNKLTPEIITNYTRVVFKDRLEVILGSEKKGINGDIHEKEIMEEYADLINVASIYYDKIFIDLDKNIDEKIRKEIIDMSDLVIVNSSQNYSSLKKLKHRKENDELLQSLKSFILIGRYDKFSKYNIKNITRFLGEKNQVLSIPYNTLFFEAACEANVPDLFLSLRKRIDSEDRNATFIEEVKRASENIVYRLQELQSKI